MNRRVAEKVRKHYEGYIQNATEVANAMHACSEEGMAMRRAIPDLIGKLGFGPAKTPPEPPKYAKGWWPYGRLKHSLNIKTRMKYNQDQLRRAAKHLTAEERTQWTIDAKIKNLAIKDVTPPFKPMSWASANSNVDFSVLNHTWI